MWPLSTTILNTNGYDLVMFFIYIMEIEPRREPRKKEKEEDMPYMP